MKNHHLGQYVLELFPGIRLPLVGSTTIFFRFLFGKHLQFSSCKAFRTWQCMMFKRPLYIYIFAIFLRTHIVLIILHTNRTGRTLIPNHFFQGCASVQPKGLERNSKNQGFWRKRCFCNCLFFFPVLSFLFLVASVHKK